MMNKKAMDTSMLYALMGIILGLIAFVPLGQCTYNLWQSQGTINEKDAFSVMVGGIKDIDSGGMRASIFVVKVGSAIAFFDEGKEPISFKPLYIQSLRKANVAPSLEYSVVRPNGCIGISCVCLATRCSVLDLEVRCEFSCEPLVAKKYTTDTSINEELKGGVFYDSGVVYRHRDLDVKLLVYREKDTLKICQNPDC